MTSVRRVGGSSVPIEVVSRVFGHASIRITADIYGHVSPETNRQAADAMAMRPYELRTRKPCEPMKPLVMPGR